MTGKGATWHENQLIPISRHGRLEEVYWTYSYGPIDDDTSVPLVSAESWWCAPRRPSRCSPSSACGPPRGAGVHCSTRRPASCASSTAPSTASNTPTRAYYDLIGHRDIMGRTLVDALPEVVPQGFVELLDRVYATGETYSVHGLRPSCCRQAPTMLPSGSATWDFVFQPIRDAGRRSPVFSSRAPMVTDRVLNDTALGPIVKARFRALGGAAAGSTQIGARTSSWRSSPTSLRNPLAPVRNAARVLRAETADAHECGEWATTVIDRQISGHVRTARRLLECVANQSAVRSH